MNDGENGRVQGLIDLRRSFDESFAAPTRPSAGDDERFVAIRCAGRPLALRVGELCRVDGGREIVPLPTDCGGLLGLAGIEGKSVPVFSLAALLGFEPFDSRGRWIAVAGRTELFGLAFESVEGGFSAAAANALNSNRQGAAFAHVQRAVRFGDDVRSIVDLQSIEAVIQSAATAGRDGIQES